MGLDIGHSRIGVALSDPGGILASPHSIIDCTDERQDIEAIIDIITQRQVGQIVVGLPRTMDGTIGGQARKVEAFTELLSSHTDVPVEFRDERLTTVSAKRLMREVGSRKAAKKTRYDAIAAAIILQSYLDERHQI